ncbi:MAG: threonine-phosphate decarboxylase CobD [Pseudomonadota bacterium]
MPERYFTATPPLAPRHGGRLREAARRYGRPPEDFLDLSTGINPLGWPVPPLDEVHLRRLPEDDDGLIEVAAGYYGSAPDHLLALPGSQAGILLLPRLRPPCRVGVLARSYAEHAHAWRMAGHTLIELDTLEAAHALDVLVLVNPNNPDGRCWNRDTLLALHAKQAARGGWLVVDEAFIDAAPRHSLAGETVRPGLFVLRSTGKFFGLAGLRTGFLLARPPALARARAALGPWTLAGPSRVLTRAALADHAWQADTRIRLMRDAARLAGLLTRHGLPPQGGTALFQWLRHPEAPALHESLAQGGVLTRLFEARDTEDTPSLRFGLPGREPDWQRLAEVLRPSLA